VVIRGTGHFLAEGSPEDLLAALTLFLASHRAAATVA
jgi:hypothetical protein